MIQLTQTLAMNPAHIVVAYPAITGTAVGVFLMTSQGNFFISKETGTPTEEAEALAAAHTIEAKKMYDQLIQGITVLSSKWTVQDGGAGEVIFQEDSVSLSLYGSRVMASAK